MKSLIKGHADNDPTLGDLAMILADEYATHMLIKAINKNLQEITSHSELPRVCFHPFPSLPFMLQPIRFKPVREETHR